MVTLQIETSGEFSGCPRVDWVDVEISTPDWLAEHFEVDRDADADFDSWRADHEDDYSTFEGEALAYALEIGSPDSGGPYGDWAIESRCSEQPGGGGSLLDGYVEFIDYVDSRDLTARVLMRVNGGAFTVYAYKSHNDCVLYDVDRASVCCDSCDASWTVGADDYSDSPVDLVSCTPVDLTDDDQREQYTFSNPYQREFYLRELGRSVDGLLLIDDSGAETVYHCPCCIAGKLEAYAY